MTPSHKREPHSNEYFEKNKEDYAAQITSIQPTFYKNSGDFINKSITPQSKVLDIGSGGVINYDFSRMSSLVCGDISLSEIAMKKYKAFDNIQFTETDILDMASIPDESFDAVIVQTVIHHLAGPRLKDTYKNTEKAINECLRVLKSGGQLLIIESTVSGWFQIIEKAVYPLMQLFFRVCKFGYVFQYSKKSLVKKLRNQGLNITEHAPVDVGPYIWIMGRKIPTRLTPCGAVWIKIEKPCVQP